MRILVSTKLLPEGFEALCNLHEVIFPKNTAFSEEELIQLIPEFDALISTFQFQINKTVIDAGKRLQIIANYGVGYNNIDVEYATKKGIAVTNTPDPVTEPTAEMAFALMHACARRIAECDRKLREPNKIKWGVLENLGVSLYGKTLGIIGLGRIGKAIAKRAIASGMNVIYFNRHQLSSTEEETLKVKYVSFNALLQTADFISISTPLTDKTFHIIDEPQLSLMKNTAILINTARGPVINEKALAKALKENQIWAAGLDVYENEPAIEPLLLELDNVVLAPHNGTATIDARNAIAKHASNCIIEFFNGNKTNITRVN